MTRRDKIREGVGRVLKKVPDCLKKDFRLSKVKKTPRIFSPFLGCVGENVSSF